MALGAMRVRKPVMKAGIKGGAGKLPRMVKAAPLPAEPDGDEGMMGGGAAPPPFRRGGAVKGGKARGKKC